MGSSFGGIMGLLLMKAYPAMNIQPGFYAMCAATAMLGSVFRSYISLVVLVVEGTQVCQRPIRLYKIGWYKTNTSCNRYRILAESM